MWDERLKLAADLYEPCDTGADIGTDHAYLPYLLLKRGICKRMLLCDVSPKAIRQATATVHHYHLEQQTRIILANGLDGVQEPCGCISLLGMGGETMADILRRGKDKLQNAVLVLSAHTELPLVRAAVTDIGYHFTRERLCSAGGRFYVIWRAEPGASFMTEDELRYGSLLYQEPTEILLPYLAFRLKVAEARLHGLQQGAAPDEAALREAAQDAAFYRQKLQS